jgi:uncharacterized protein YbjT (DUF2867 family)
MQKISHNGNILDQSKTKERIYSACGDGKVPFISAGDIAAVAFHVLTDEKPPQTDYRVLGPELLSHDQVKFPLVTRLVMF